MRILSLYRVTHHYQFENNFQVPELTLNPTLSRQIAAAYTDPLEILHIFLSTISKPAHWAANSRGPSVEDMSVDHGCLDVTMTEKLLDRADVVSPLKQVRGEGMSGGVARGSLDQARLGGGISYRLLNERGIDIMAPLFLWLQYRPITSLPSSIVPLLPQCLPSTPYDKRRRPACC